MIEAMVALVVISVGLLGIAKMQALAMSSTGTAKLRALAALESASLASTIRADRAYWSAITVNTSVTFQDGAVKTSTDAALQSAAICETPGACSSITDMVAYDLGKWVGDLATQMPNHTATLNCTSGSATAPATCIVTLNWAENRVAINAQSTGQPVLANQYILYVEP